MGLSNFPNPAEGLLYALVGNTFLTVTLLKNLVRSVLQVTWITSNSEQNPSIDQCYPTISENARARRVLITRYGSLCKNRSTLARATNSGNTGSSMECCVCLCRFEADEVVSELACKHFFHKGCLDKWFDNHHHSTCPLCRSIL
ncbi:probable E3 ubiquitin-protein ligase XERICO [Cornus florida]|uniref:probable E3 ubiquitin-protein ligase XERICO n=1 Tax=Cornus florida TaxID=4283 RepID=UPI00289E1C89|nr:probable E3 ubiquitin-protein ligase XERICO [Cornus florida]